MANRTHVWEAPQPELVGQKPTRKAGNQGKKEAGPVAGAVSG